MRLFHDGRLIGPFVYSLVRTRDPETLQRYYNEDRSDPHRIHFFVRTDPYKLLGFIRTDLHLFGVLPPATLYLFGTDELGRDMFSRVLYAGRVSLSVGLLGVTISFLLGVVIGGISGYVGGPVDTVIQRIIEFLISIPTLPLWMGLTAALPPRWPALRVYFGITIILSILGWTGLARVVRGKLLELRGGDFVVAARVSGATAGAVIRRHLLPSFLSYLIVHLTLAVPNMIPRRNRAQLHRPGPQGAGGELGRAADQCPELPHRRPEPLAADPGAVRGGHRNDLHVLRRRPPRRRRPLQVASDAVTRSSSDSSRRGWPSRTLSVQQDLGRDCPHGPGRAHFRSVNRHVCAIGLRVWPVRGSRSCEGASRPT